MEGIGKFRRDEEATRRAATAIGTRRHNSTNTTDMWHTGSMVYLAQNGGEAHGQYAWRQANVALNIVYFYEVHI